MSSSSSKSDAEEVLGRRQVLATLLGFPAGLDLVRGRGQGVDAHAARVVDGVDDRHVVGALEHLGAAAGAVRTGRTRSLEEDEVEVVRDHVDGGYAAADHVPVLVLRRRSPRSERSRWNARGRRSPGPPRRACCRPRPRRRPT